MAARAFASEEARRLTDHRVDAKINQVTIRTDDERTVSFARCSGLSALRAAKPLASRAGPTLVWSTNLLYKTITRPYPAARFQSFSDAA